MGVPHALTLIAILLVMVGFFKLDEGRTMKQKAPIAEAAIIFIFGLICIAFSIRLSHAFGSHPTPLPSPTVHTTPSPVPSLGLPGRPRASGLIGFRCVTCTGEEKERVRQAELTANAVVQSQCFTDFLLAWGMIETKGKSPLAVIKHLQNAVLTVPVHYYYDSSPSKAIGYRQPPYPDIYFNRFYHKYYGVCDTASNGTHEWSHSLGYTHPFNKTPTRGRTVPYSINLAFEKCCLGSKGYRGH